jgi:type I restriction enzyme S subunit
MFPTSGMTSKPLSYYCLESGAYGIPASAEDYDDTKYRYLRITDISDDGELLNNDVRGISHPDADQYLLGENDIVFARTGNSTGRSFFYEAKYGPLVYAGFLIRYNINPDLINPRYLKYFTLSRQYREWIANFSGGSTRGKLSASDYSEMPVYAPSRSQQDLLVRVLDSITDKIALNTRINAELEEMAKLLYDYWFVQFDFPNAKGKPYKSSGGAMVHNAELKREVPEGWEVGTLASLGDIIGGTTPSTTDKENFCTNGTPWITPKDMSNNSSNRYITRGEADVSDKGIASASLRLMPAGTVLLTSRAPIGYMAISREPFTTNQGFKSFVPNKGYSSAVVFETVRLYLPAIIAKGSGSTFAEVSMGTIKSIRIILPPKDLAEQFTKVVFPIYQQINTLELQNHELTTLRDWLLPMLMNGQVVVGEAAEKVGLVLSNRPS